MTRRWSAAIGLSNMRRGVAETASLGYWVGEPFARQRYMTRGVAAGPRFRLRPAAACTASRRPACRPTCRAARLLLRTGFQQEGYARDYLLIDGKWQDHLLFAILREDWRG